MKCKIIFLISCICALFGCDKFAGNTLTETFDISNTYKALFVYNAIDVVITDAVEEVRVTTGENLMSNVIISENGDRLDVRLKEGSYFFNSIVKVELPSNPNLVKVVLSDASDIECEVNAEEFVINLTDASDANLQGHVGKLTIKLDDASSIKKNIINNRYALSCDECEVSMSGASDAYIHCDGNIKVVELYGASDLHYTGSATITLAEGLASSFSDIKHDVL